MKSIIKYSLIAVISAFVGAISIIGLIKISPNLHSKIFETKTARVEKEKPIAGFLHDEDQPSSSQESLFDDDFFAMNDPFKRMDNIRKQLEKEISQSAQMPLTKRPHIFSQSFDSGVAGEISTREDEKSIYYDIKVRDLNSTSLTSKVENGYVTISGTTEKKLGFPDEKENESHGYFKSSFNRTFPISEKADAYKMEMMTEKDKIVLKFPKIKT